MAGFTFTVTFKGHCSFAPKKGGGEAIIFLPDQREASKARPKLEDHHAAVIVDAVHLSPADNPPGEVVWHLDHQHLRFVPQIDTTAAGLDIVGLNVVGTPGEPSLVRRPVPANPAYKSEFGFSWLAPLEKACLSRGLGNGGGIIEESFRDPELSKEDANLLVARIELTKGKLFISKFLLDPETGKHIVWRFRSFAGPAVNGDHLQVLGGDVVLEQKIDGAYVTLEAQSLSKADDPEKKQSLKLYPRDEAIEIKILNEESEEFMKTRIPGSIVLKQARERDRIFESFYKLVKSPPPPDEMPLPAADYLLEKEEGGQPAQVAPPCSPSRLEPYV